MKQFSFSKDFFSIFDYDESIRMNDRIDFVFRRDPFVDGRNYIEV